MLRRIDPKKGHTVSEEGAIFHFVWIDVDHQRNPMPPAALMRQRFYENHRLWMIVRQRYLQMLLLFDRKMSNATGPAKVVGGVSQKSPSCCDSRIDRRFMIGGSRLFVTKFNRSFVPEFIRLDRSEDRIGLGRLLAQHRRPPSRHIGGSNSNRRHSQRWQCGCAGYE
jgi:hypothetical protein